MTVYTITVEGTTHSMKSKVLELLGAGAFRPQRTGNGTRAGLCSDDPQGIKGSPLERWSSRPQIKIGPRGGAYTEDVTKDGRPYRRYY